MHPRLMGEINEVRFATGLPNEAPDGQNTGIGTNTREAQGLTQGRSDVAARTEEFHRQTARQDARRTRIASALLALRTLFAVALGGIAPPPVARAAEMISAQDAHSVGVTAYLYLYPLVTMDLTRKQLTNVAMAQGISAPAQHFRQRGSIPDRGHEDRGAAEF